MKVEKDHRKACPKVGSCSCKWMTRITVRDVNGVEHMPKIRAATKAELRKRVTEKLHESDAGRLANSGGIDVERNLDDWFDAKADGGEIRAGSLLRYRSLARVHVVPRIGRIKLEKLTRADVSRVLREMQKAGLARSTVRQAGIVLKGSLKWAVEEGRLAVSPAAAVKLPTPGKAKLNVPDPETVRRILAEAARGSVWYVPLALLATTGMRRGEVLAMRWADVDLEAARLHVTGSLQRVGSELKVVDPKTDASRRTVVLPPSAVALLRRHRIEQAERRLLIGEAWHDDGFVCDGGTGRPLSPSGLSHAFEKFVARVGAEGIRTHDLRHHFAVAALRANVHPRVVQSALGHSSIAVTMDTYSHVMPSMGQAAADAIEQALGSLG